MTDEQKAAYIVGLSACLFAKILGMETENRMRLQRNQNLAYVQADFEKAVDESGCHSNAMISFFHS